MNILKTPSYSATITIGMQIGYSKEHYTKEVLISFLQEFQKTQIEEREIFLSTGLSECQIILSGHIEPHLKLDFINYPKFPLEEIQFKNEIELLIVFLMEKLKQNRIVVVYHNETKMFEKSEQLDPRIKCN